jgi:hypothetical protein
MDRMEIEKDFIIKLVVRKEKERKKEGRRWNPCTSQCCPLSYNTTSPPFSISTIIQVHLNIPAVFIFLNICSAKTAQSLLIGEVVPSSFPRDTPTALPMYTLQQHTHTPGMRERCLSLPDVLYTLVCVCVWNDPFKSNSVQRGGWIRNFCAYTRSIDARERDGNWCSI